MDGPRKIIVSTSRHEQGSAPQQTIRTAPRWLLYLILVPVSIVLAVLGMFFFAALFALFALAAAGFGLRLWWLRRKLRQSMASMDAHDGEYTVIEDAEIIETRTDKTKQ